MYARLTASLRDSLLNGLRACLCCSAGEALVADEPYLREECAHSCHVAACQGLSCPPLAWGLWVWGHALTAVWPVGVVSVICWEPAGPLAGRPVSLQRHWQAHHLRNVCCTWDACLGLHLEGTSSCASTGTVSLTGCRGAAGVCEYGIA